jgi:HNH endonuclease
MSRYISDVVRAFVSRRAEHRCEYCRFHEDDMFIAFPVDHIIAVKHGGGNEPENLANTCQHCNQHKGTDLTTFLDAYHDIEVLFNPRIHVWTDHFEVGNGEILPLSRIGRATIKLLRFNDPDLIILRQILIQAGRFP